MNNNLTPHQKKALEAAKSLIKSVEQIKREFLFGKYSEAQFDNATRERLNSAIAKINNALNNNGIH